MKYIYLGVPKMMYSERIQLLMQGLMRFTKKYLREPLQYTMDDLFTDLDTYSFTLWIWSQPIIWVIIANLLTIICLGKSYKNWGNKYMAD